MLLVGALALPSRQLGCGLLTPGAAGRRAGRWESSILDRVRKRGWQPLPAWGLTQKNVQVGQRSGRVKKVAAIQRTEQIRKYVKVDGSQVFTLYKGKTIIKRNPEAGLELGVPHFIYKRILSHVLSCKAGRNIYTRALVYTYLCIGMGININFFQKPLQYIYVDL